MTGGAPRVADGRGGGRVWTTGAGGPAPCTRGPCFFGRERKREPRRPLETAWGRMAGYRRVCACGLGMPLGGGHLLFFAGILGLIQF